MVRKILSVDGGGMYGVVPLEVCIAIEEQTNKRLKDIFDLLVGTSTGALIAAAAVAGLGGPDPFGLPAKEIKNIYLNRREDIFGEDAINRLNVVIPIIDVRKYPKYNWENLRRVVTEVVGAGENVAKMGHVFSRRGKHLSVAAYDVTNRKPHFFRSWTEEDRNILIRDVLMASSSAPTSHPLYPIGESYYTDGGVFAANPALFALADAMSLFPGEELVLVSLGTGIPEAQNSLSASENPEDDIRWWLENIFNIFLDGQIESADQTVTQIANQANWLNYFRFDVNLQQDKRADEIELDVLNEAANLMKNELNNGQKHVFDTMISLL